METEASQIIGTESIPASDAAALEYFRQSIAGGKHWYIALLGAIGLWSSAEEVRDERTYRYLIDGEAFDWLLLAERICETADGLLPAEEKDALLFHGIPPIELTADDARELVGEQKYGQYLNYFYGVTVEEALFLAVQREIEKERWARVLRTKNDSTEEVYQRIYESPMAALLKQFRQEKGLSQHRSITLTEMKGFTYWLFKYRVKRCEKAKIASDTKKALAYLQEQWRQKGVSGVLATNISIKETD